MKKINICFIIFVIILFFFTSCNRNPLEKGGKKLAKFELNYAKAWGTEFKEDLAGAVVDNIGNLYFVGRTGEGDDFKFLFLNKINLNDNSFTWSKKITSPHNCYFASPYNIDDSNYGGGGSRCIACDEIGNVYIVGNVKQMYNKVFVLKISPDGQILWQKLWNANNTNSAGSNAKAYSVDVKNNKLFIAGTTGASTNNENAMAFLLILDSATGTVEDDSSIGIDISPANSDFAYTLKVTNNGYVYLAGKGSRKDTGVLMRFSEYGKYFNWCKQINIQTDKGIIDMDIDSYGYIYLATNLGELTNYLGLIKISSTDLNLVWAKKYSGKENKINSLSSVRILDDQIFLCGKASFKKYDNSTYGDGCVVQLNVDGSLFEDYIYYTGKNNNCGERFKNINKYNGRLFVIGETTPEHTQIEGHWYVPSGLLSDFSPEITNITEFERFTGKGVLTDIDFVISDFDNTVFDLSSGTKGVTDLVIFGIKK